MSIINSMLRDLDRRHAPLPQGGDLGSPPPPRGRRWPHSALVLCAVIGVAVWSWHQHSTPPAKTNPTPAGTTQKAAPVTKAASAPAAKPRREMPAAHVVAPVSPPQPTLATRLIAAPAQKAVVEQPAQQSVHAGKPTAIAKQPKVVPTPQKTVATKSTVRHTGGRDTATVVKQNLPTADPDAERYRLARIALAENDPRRAYELLRDDPPPLAQATDYHAVLAAVEQQLGYYADASRRYRRLLAIDPQRARWWLGLALSLDGEHRDTGALAAYRRATAPQTLPAAAQRYAAARTAALTHALEH